MELSSISERSIDYAGENVSGYFLSADISCSEKRTVFRECSSSKTVSFEEQIISKDVSVMPNCTPRKSLDSRNISAESRHKPESARKLFFY